MGISVLIIDDNASITRTFARILQKNGYEADVAQSGKEALQKVKAKHFDLALVDVCLPDMNGLDLLERLREIDSSIVRIVISGSVASEPNSAEVADAYLQKPIKPQELLAIIEQKIKHTQ